MTPDPPASDQRGGRGCSNARRGRVGMGLEEPSLCPGSRYKASGGRVGRSAKNRHECLSGLSSTLPVEKFSPKEARSVSNAPHCSLWCFLDINFLLPNCALA